MKDILICCVILYYLLSSGVTLLFAQDKQLEFIGVQNGLSQGMVYHMLQEKTGYLWFATKDGLNRYDGHQFEVFAHAPDKPYSISDHTQHFLLNDSRGWIWVATEHKGVDIFVPETGRFYHLVSNHTNSSLLSNKVYMLAEAPDGSVWVASTGGINRIVVPDKFSFNMQTASVLNDTFAIQKLISDGLHLKGVSFIDKFVYWSDEQHVYKGYWHADSLFEPVILETLNAGLDHFSTMVHQVLQDGFGNLWFVRPHALTRFDGELVTQIPLEVKFFKPPAGVLINEAGNELLIGTSTLRRFYIDENGISHISLLADLGDFHCNNILQDHAGNIWLGTSGYGLIKYNPGKKYFNHLFPGNSTQHFSEDNRGRLFTWANYKINQIDEQKGEFTEPVDIPEGLLNSRVLHHDPFGNYWFHRPFEEEGVKMVKWNPDSGTILEIPYANRPYSLTGIFEDLSNHIWIGTRDGYLLRFNSNNQDYFALNLTILPEFTERKFTVSTLIQHSDSIYWVATSIGLLQFELNGFEITNHRFYSNIPDDVYSLSENFILSMLQDESDPNILWLGTKGGGLNKFRKSDGRVLRITTVDGLPNNVIYGILPYNDDLWLSTNRGLAVYNTTSKQITSYSENEGLQSEEFNTFSFLKTNRNKLVFGGINGINIFSPDDIKENAVAPNTVITQVKVNNASVHGFTGYSMPFDNPVLNLKHNQNILSFRFAALDFTAPAKHVFKYRLSGVYGDWVFADNLRELTFTNLTPGSYTFEVLGTNNSGVWSELPARFEFKISPPWWKTSLAYISYLIILILIAIGIIHYRISRFRLKNQLAFEQREAERLQEMDRLKTGFFSNITHEFRTPLTLIIEPVRQLIAKAENEENLKKLKLAERNSLQLLQLVNQLLDLSKLEAGYMEIEPVAGDIAEVFQSTIARFQPLADKKGIELELKVPEAPLILEFDRGKIELILNNLLSNAIKYSPENSRIYTVCNVKQDKDAHYLLAFSVQDEGPGIPVAEQERIFDRFYQLNVAGSKNNVGTGIGLALTKELTTLMGGRIWVDCNALMGSTFIVQIPAKSGSFFNVEAVEPALQSQNEYISVQVYDNALLAAKPGFNPEIPLLLLVEDNSELSAFIADSLRPDYSIIHAENGEIGIQMAIQHIPDLIISDIMMPEKNGLELCDHLKGEQLTAHIPIVLLTARSTMDSKLKGLQAGADDYLTKPFNSIELRTRVQNLIEVRQRLRQKYETKQPSGFMSEESPDEALPELDKTFLDSILRLINDNLEHENFTIEQIAEKMFVSRVQLYRKVKALTNLSPSEFVRNHRLDVAKQMLQQKQGNVSEVSVWVGLPNRSYFSRSFKQRFGIPPSEV